MNREITQGHWLARQSKLNISLSARSQGDMLFSSPCLYSQVCDSVHKKSFRQSVMAPKLDLIAFYQQVVGEMDQNLAWSKAFERKGVGGVVHIVLK